jgi:quinate/shikimate dehydrogenase (NAD+)
VERVLLGLIGSRIGRSISPAMHEAAGRAAGFDVRYHLIDASVIGFAVDALPRLLSGVRLAGFAGMNVTFPFKEAVVPCLDGVEGAARLVGAVNTVVVRDAQLVGHNTDYSGFISGWTRALGKRRPGVAALIGAGGVGRAIAHALVELGAEEVRVSDIDPARSRALVETLRSRYPVVRAIVAPGVEAACAGATGVVNATPVGMHAFPGSPVPEAFLSGIAWAADAVYTPLETAFVAAVRGSGAAVMTGQELAIGQAMDAFELFFGRPAQEGVMRDAFLARVAASAPTGS